MTRGQARNSLRWDGTRGVRTPRLRLKPTAHGTGYVDGAWWPRSDDLMTELPDLIAVLSVGRGAISRVMFNLSEWTTMPAELATGGRAVRLGAYRQQVTTQYSKPSATSVLTTCLPRQQFRDACFGDSRTSTKRQSPAQPPPLCARPWRAASSRTPWSNSRPKSSN